MRLLISVCGLFLAVMAYTFGAQANIDVTCNGGDCLINGWEVYDTYKNESMSVVCSNSNCAREGWTGVYKELTQDITECKGGDCFKYGWSVYAAATNTLKADVTCRIDRFGISDCLRAGWDVQDYEYHVNQSILCINGDCDRFGWDIFTPGYPTFATRCKFGGCFLTGWISYR
jgi:hypothetical protein